MQFELTTKKYIEQSGEANKFACVYTHLPQSDAIKEVRGTLYTMVNLKLAPGDDAVSAVNVFLDNLETVYFSQELTTIPSVFEKAIKSALFAMDGYFRSVSAGDDIIFDFAACVIKDDILYIAKVEEGYIYLIRDNKALDLGGSLEDVSNPKVVENASGVLQLGDKVILANAAAQELIADWNLLSRYTEAEINRLINPSLDGEDKVAFLVVELDLPKIVPHESLDGVMESATVAATAVASGGGESEQLQEDAAKTSLMGKAIALNDSIAERVLPLLGNIFHIAKTGITAALTHRGEVKDAIVQAVHKAIDAVKSITGKKKVPSLERRSMIEAVAVNNGDALHKRSIQKIRKDKHLMVPAALIILGFFFILFLHIKSDNAHSQKLAEYAQLSKQLASDSKLLQSDPPTLASIYKHDQTLLSEAYALGVNPTQINAYKQKINQAYDGAYDIVPVNPQVLSDLSLSFGNITPNSIDVAGNTLYVTAATNGDLFTLPTTGVSSGTKVTSSQLSSPESVAALDNSDVVVYDKNEGVLEINNSGTVTPIPGLSDIADITSMATFQGNLYFLDSQDQIIYKSVQESGGGYALATTYIPDSNLADAASIAVDGNVFAASPTLGILRFYGGQSTPFTIGNLNKLDRPLGPLTYIYDTQYLQNIYAVDPQNDRIIVLQKPTGSDTVTYNFVRQYVYTGTKGLFSNLTAIAIDTNEENMYVLNGPKVLKVKL